MSFKERRKHFRYPVDIRIEFIVEGYDYIRLGQKHKPGRGFNRNKRVVYDWASHIDDIFVA